MPTLIKHHHKTKAGLYLVLACGHWFKWNGIDPPPTKGRAFTCQSCLKEKKHGN